MPDLVEDIEIYPRMVAIAGAVETELKRRNLPTSWVSVLPEGLVVLDYFGDDCDGWGWVRLATSNPYRNFPVPDGSAQNCDAYFFYQLEVGYAHCAPMAADDGTPPSSTELLEAARIQTAAMVAMRVGIANAMDELDAVYSLGTYNANLAGGGVLGATWTVNLGDRRG